MSTTTTDPATAPVVNTPVTTTDPSTGTTVPVVDPTATSGDGGDHTITDPNLEQPTIITRPHGPGLVLTPGFIFFDAVPEQMSDVTRTAVGYYPIFAAMESPFTGTPAELVIHSSGPVTLRVDAWEGKEQSLTFEKALGITPSGKFTWVIFSDASTQLVDSIVGAAKLEVGDETRTFAVKKEMKHEVFSDGTWKYIGAYYCE